MRNFVQKGDVLTVAAPAGGVLSGEFVKIGSLAGFAQVTAEEGESVAIATTGVFEVTVAATGGVTVGQDIFWTGSAFTTAADNGATPAVAHAKIGFATTSASASATAVVDVKIG